MLSGPPSTGSDEIDLIWGETDDVPGREWSKMDQEFTNAGYREGITAGKEGALQEGFDDGFATVGAPLGREVGILRGAANAILSTFSTLDDSGSETGPLEERREELWSIIRSLGQIHLADLAPRDVQAEEHAKEHLGDQTPGDVVLSLESANGTQPVEYHLNEREKPAVEELKRLRSRLSDILQAMGLDVSLD